MTLLCCTDSLPLLKCTSVRLSVAEYDAIWEERQRRFNAFAARRLHASNGVPIVDPLGHEQHGPTKGKGAIGREENGVLKHVVVVSDGQRRHRTVPTHLGPFMILKAGQAYVGSDPTRLQRDAQEDRADQDSAET